MSFEFKWENNNCIFSFRENLDMDGLMEASNLLIGDARFESMEYTIFDLRDIKKHSLDHNDIRIIATIDKGASRWNKYLKVACITNDDYTKNIVLDYKKLLNVADWKIELFENMDEALTWCRSSS